jgi:hypothetical protein
MRSPDVGTLVWAALALTVLGSPFLASAQVAPTPPPTAPAPVTFPPTPTPTPSPTPEPCDNHTAHWTGCKAGHSLYYTESAWRRVGGVRIRQGLVPRMLRSPELVDFIAKLEGWTREEAIRAGHTIEVDGYTAVTDCTKIGWIAYMSLNGGPIRRMHILDCSHPDDVALHVADRRVGEVNETALRRDGCVWPSGETKGRCPATVLHDIRRN